MKKKIIIAALILAVAVNPELALSFISGTLNVLRPVLIGMAIAFVLNRPICKIYEFYISIKGKAATKKHCSPFIAPTKTAMYKEAEHSNWIISITIGYILLAVLISTAVGIIIPQTAESVRALSENSDFYIDKIQNYYAVIAEKDKFEIIPAIGSALKKLGEKLPDLVAGFYGKTTEFVGFLGDFFIGIIISVYILVSKDKLRAIVRKISAKIMSKESYARYSKLYYTIYDVFSRFVSGQITEACIIGMLCFFGMKLFGFEYALLISFIIGITALLPVVGAIIGTVPCAFLLFLDDPMSAVWFVVFIIVLQQLENNLIYPRVVGKSMGLSSLPILIAILIGAKLGGGLGILIAVPITSVVYGILMEKLEKDEEFVSHKYE